MKKLSVIIPVYNVEKLLRNAVESVLRQAYSNLEVILVDDGSSDQSLAVCRQLKREDDRVVVINGGRRGVSHARNEGLGVATGDYVAFVDADDTIHTEMYSDMIARLEQQNAKMALCNYERISPRGRAESVRDLARFTGETASSRQLIHALMSCWHGQLYGSCWRCVFVRAHIIENGIRFEETIAMCEDLLFVMRYLLSVEGCILCQACHYNYFLRSDFKKRYMKNHDSMLKKVDAMILAWAHQYQFDPETMLHVEMRRATTLVGDIKNICRRGSPYSLRERFQFVREKTHDPQIHQSLTLAAGHKGQVVPRRYNQICLFKRHRGEVVVLFQSIRFFNFRRHIAR